MSRASKATGVCMLEYSQVHDMCILCSFFCLQACGQWEKALEIAEKSDRIHLKTTHYAFAQVEKGDEGGGGVLDWLSTCSLI